jgi:membrane-bound inhibitor of C-type lysozyme
MIMRAFGFLAVLGIISVAPLAATAQSAMSPMSLPPSMRPAKKVTVRYVCSGLHVTAIYDNVKDRVSFVWGAKDNHLPHVPSADGVRYANASLEWWEKGNDATLSSMPGHDALATCSTS